jgi:hypothetical protein
VLWTLSPAGVITQHDLRDGRVLRTGSVPLAGGEAQFMFAVDGLLIVDVEADGVSRQLRFDAATLAEVPQTRPVVRHIDCGAHWCVETFAPASGDAPTAVVDKATGAVRYHLPQGTYVEPAPGGLVLGRPDVDVFGILLTSLVDTDTGRELADLSGWQLLPDQPRPVRLLIRGSSVGPVQLAQLTPTGYEVVAELPGGVGRCVVAAQRLACTDGAGGLALWRIPA